MRQYTREKKHVSMDQVGKQENTQKKDKSNNILVINTKSGMTQKELQWEKEDRKNKPYFLAGIQRTNMKTDNRRQMNIFDKFSQNKHI